jgi:zinc resistance-associated protein
MLKPLLVAMATLALAGSSNVGAQQCDYGRDGNVLFEHHHHGLDQEERAAVVDARITALKAGLELTPDQAKSWPAFEQALRDMAQLRAQLRAARKARMLNPTPTTPFERMTRRAENMAKRSTALKRVADAATPLYQSLNDTQKERLDKLARILRPHHHFMDARNNVGPGPSSERDGGDRSTK